jgi:predicted DCC family thiol-disulfide oxidoreductase YuxK
MSIEVQRTSVNVHAMHSEKSSYRMDPSVPDFPDGDAILFFDGVCVLCSGFVQFILHRDTRKRLRFCAAQSPLGQAIYRHYGLETRKFETNILLSGGTAFFKSDAFIESMSILGGWCRLAVVMRLCPGFIRDRVYDPIARNRYAWFGERSECFVPRREQADRFLS